MPIAIRLMTADDWETFRDLRLEALADAPDAFRATLTEEAETPDAEWKSLGERTAEHDDAEMFLVEVDGMASGLAFARIDRGAECVHIGAMWVEPSARRVGGGRALVSAALGWGAERGATSAMLAVTLDNGPAERLYSSLGFQPTGRTEPLRDGAELQVAWMARRL